jgi:hypothetical protein
MLDTIDKLTEPTVCSLLDGTVELALAKVFPSQKACHSVPVKDGFVVVQPTYVWANTSQYLLTVNSCIKVRLDLQADKSPVVVKGPFFPRLVNPRYRIRGTMCNARIQSSKAMKSIL